MMRLSTRNIRSLVVGTALRHPCGVLLVAALGVAFSLLLTATRLEFHTSRLDLISAGERYKQLDQAYSQEFAELPERVIVVIRSPNPERAKAFATALAQRWETDLGIDQVWYRIDAEALKNKALFYLSSEDLRVLRQRLHQHRDLLHELSGSPTLPNLFGLINRQITRALVGHVFTGFLEEDQEEKKPVDLSLLLALLREMNGWLDGPRAYRSLWETWFTQGAEGFSHDGFLWSEDNQLLFVLVHPKAEAGRFNRFETAVQQIRADVRAVQQAYPDVEVGVTGRAVLEADEMAAAQRDTTLATLLALLGVASLFVGFFKGMVRPGLAILTLLAGFGWSFGWTTLTIGHLNIFTVVFGPMLIGLGIDYVIHFLARYEEERTHGRSIREALDTTVAGTGPGILAAALTTAFAFYVLLLTDFRGLGELGFITGSGLLLMLLATFTCFPALLVLDERRRPSGMPAGGKLRGKAQGSYLAPLYRYPRAILAASALLVGLSLLGLGRVGFDFNLLRLQAEGTESVVWVHKIFQSTKRSVLFGEVVAGSLDEVRRKAAALKALPSVAKVESLASLIPEDQERKLPLIQELRPLLADLPLPQAIAETMDLAALRSTLGRIKFKMVEEGETAGDAEEEVPREEMHEVRRLIAQFFAKTEAMGRAEVRQALTAFQEKMGRDLTDKLATLKRNLDAEPVTLADLPPELHTRYVGRTGTYRLFAFPAENVWEFQPLARFVADLTSVDPDALGPPVMNFAYLQAMKAGYEKAGVYALLGIAVLAFLTFRAVGPTLLSLLPLAVGVVWTLGLMALLGVPFNMANLLFVPLIMGVGIDNGIHVVHRFREANAKTGEPSPLARSTGRAISFSSLTTLVGFGSLLISSHRGIHSLGLLIALGVGSVLIASLTTLPSLLALLGSRREQRAVGLPGGPGPAPGDRPVQIRPSERREAVAAQTTTGREGKGERGEES